MFISLCCVVKFMMKQILLIHVNHAVQECPEEHVGAKATHELVGQQIPAVDEEFAPLGTGLQKHQNPKNKNREKVEQEAQRSA